MKAQNVIAIAAAVLFTSASLFTTAGLSGTHSNGSQQAPTEINGHKVINLAPVNVRPSAEERRAAALLADIDVVGITTIPAFGRLGGAEQASLAGSPLAMPYYSFGKFGRIGKE
jgi:hypothetical protein